ncbi:T9SS type A sorting domain-containing protein [Flavicella sp.]|uniref:T9SS type A sorting domain-containing protein n=1 Tax=Flavicella sp. TaxID=2957742 RepID=UPI0026352F13|nr:T9SS type A sorting domain-containing protein [Flavicella sp.]MDG1805605.1 T9SS type A sorting domain-containing protein [Flavicella sp.]
MKKITLSLFLMLPFMLFSQGTYTFDFENSDPPNDVWTVKSSLTTSIGSGDLNLALTNGASNPMVGTLSGGINAEVYRYVAITLKNPSAQGPTYIRFSFPKSPSGRKYISYNIDNNHNDYRTYYFDVSSEPDWENTVDDMRFHFKATDNADYVVPAEGIEVNVSEIVFHEVSYSGYVQNPSFENELVGWSMDTGTSAAFQISETEGVGGSKAAEISYNGTLAAGDIKFENPYVYDFETDIPETYSVTLDFQHKGIGTVADIQVCIKLSYSDAIGGSKTFYQGWVNPGTDYAVSSNDRSLDDGVGDDNTYKSITVFFRAKNGDATSKVYLDDIVTNIKDENGDDVLSVPLNEIIKEPFLVYPNPVRDMLYVSKTSKILEVYDVVGNLITREDNTDRIEVGFLKSGAYILKSQDENGAVVSKVFMKK